MPNIIKCPHCGKEMDIMADVTISMPSRYYRNLTKKSISKKEVEIWGVNWADAEFICPACGLVKQPGKGKEKFDDQRRNNG